MTPDEAYLTILPECKSGVYPDPAPTPAPVAPAPPVEGASAAPTVPSTTPLGIIRDIVTFLCYSGLVALGTALVCAAVFDWQLP